VCHKALCKQCAKAKAKSNTVVDGAAAALGILKSEQPILIPQGPAIQDEEISLLAEPQ